MAAVGRLLVERDPGLVKLLDPAFDISVLDPGYIKGYVPGVRENGGQYTHAAVWAAMAFALMGDGENAWELLSMLNPIHHGSDAAGIDLYKAEPYVMCADIYAAPPHRGRGGWSWYTGAAGWMYQLVTETLLGLHLEVDKLRLVPLMPKEWTSYKIHYRYRETFYHITVARPDGGGGASGREAAQSERVTRVRLDGGDLDQTGPLQGIIPLTDDRRDHHVEVEVG
jgi:cellobiose phosphorylase